MSPINSSTLKLNILTFNWHEPYLCLLAKLGHDFNVVEPEIAQGHVRQWDTNMRQVPANVKLLSLDQAKANLKANVFDLAIAQNIKDLIWLQAYGIPKIIVFHNKLTTEIALADNSISSAEYREKIQFLLKGVERVFISYSKRKDWGLEGHVIPPGIDTGEYGSYTGEITSVLRIGNLMKERDLMMGFSASQQIMEGFPGITLGLNPGLPGVRLSQGFDDLLNHYRKCRCFINTTAEGYEDGYNLAMLEAMATGMPVVSTFNRTSPIQNGVNGFISTDIAYLKRCVEELLVNPKLARELGENARQTIIDKFNIKTYLDNWNKVISETIMNYINSSGDSLSDDSKMPFHAKAKKNILMDYTSYPATTAFYIERALRKHHDVITCGGMITPEIIQHWNLEALKWEIKPQDISCGHNTPLSEIMKHLPKGWTPDFYLWVENGISSFAPDLDSISIPKACYLIDTHLHLLQHQEIARHFDFVFIAQKEYLNAFKTSGSPNTYWLPLACDPEIHGKVETEIKYDVGFIGSITPSHTRRKKLLHQIGLHFNLYIDRKFMNEMAQVFSQSKIVFNEAIRNDLNMRVFEGLCAGNLLVTDTAPGSGLADLFHDKTHLAIYQDETLVDTIRYYLDHPEERLRIAEQGRQEVLANHTYENRIKTMISKLDEHFKNVESADQGSDSKLDNYYHNIRHDILPLIPESAQCILEVGCASGFTGKELKKSRKIFIAGIELNPIAAEEARQNLDDVLVGNIENMELPYQEHSFDCIVMADVIEHLVDPLSALKKLKPYLKEGGTIIASIPNVQFFGLVSHLIEGNWTYAKEGILDETHLRFFTYNEIEKLFKSAGYDIEKIEETLDPQYEIVDKANVDTLNVGRLTIGKLTKEEMRRFFVFQYKIVAQMKVSQEALNERRKRNLIADAKASEDDKNYVEALEKYDYAFTCFPDSVEIMVGLGNGYLRAQDFINAEKFYRKAISANPKNMEGWLGMGLLETQTGNYDSAVISFSTILGHDPRHDKALCGLGMVCYQKGLKSDAMNYFLRALKYDIENKTALMFMMGLSYELNQYPAAEEILSKYLKLHPANLNIMFGLAGIQYKMNKLSEARDNLEKVLIFEPDRADAQQLLDRVLEEMQVEV